MTSITRVHIAQTSYLLVASLTAIVNPFNAALWKCGANNPLKSAPTRLKDKPKYIHWPRRESRRPPTPFSRSTSRMCRNWDTCQCQYRNSDVRKNWNHYSQLKLVHLRELSTQWLCVFFKLVMLLILIGHVTWHSGWELWSCDKMDWYTGGRLWRPLKFSVKKTIEKWLSYIVHVNQNKQ